MMPIDRLVRRIGAVLRGEAEGFEARALASHYAALLESTRERLQQCTNLIRAKNEHTALQVAESHPAVLDLAAKLSFADAAQWRAWCKDAGLPAPAPLEEYLIDMVNALYSKEIDQSHPLYKEYRAAVREHDEIRALTVLRSITRINVNDANAHDEFNRLSAKVRRELLGKLREAFAHHRNDEAFAVMALLETSGLGPFEDNADWRDAAKARDDWEKRRMQGEALMTLPELTRLMQSGEWEACIPLLAKAQSLRSQYAFRISPEDAKLFAHIETWVTGHAEVADKVRRERALMDDLLVRIEALDKRLKTPAATDADSLADIAELDTWIAEASAAPDTAHLGKAIHVAKSHRLERQAAHLKFKARRFSRHLSLTAATLAAGAVAAYYAVDAVQRHRFALALSQAEALTTVRPLHAFLAGPVKDRPEYAADDDHPTRIEALRRRAEAADHLLVELLASARAINTGLDQNTLAAAAALAQFKTLEARFSQLPADLRDDVRPELDRAGRTLAAKRDAAASTAREAILAAGLALDELMGKAGEPASIEAWPAAAARLSAALTATDAPAGEVSDTARATLQRAKATFAQAEARALLTQAAAEATTLDALVSAARKATALPGEGPLFVHARLVEQGAPALRSLPAALLPPETAALAPWATPGTRFISGEITALEASDAAKLTAECARWIDPWRLTLTRHTGDGTTAVTQLLFKGRPTIETFALSGGIETRTKGDRYKADGTTEPVAFTYRQFDGRMGTGDQPGQPAKAAEGELLAAYARLFDADRGVFTESPLTLIDRAYAARAASPLLRSRLILLTAAILEARPEARGLAFAPELRDELLKLKTVIAGAPAAGAWLTPERFGDILPALNRHYTTPRPAYAPFADFRAKLIRATLAAGCTFVGVCDEQGRPLLRTPAPGKSTRLLGLDTQGRPAIIGIIGEAGTVIGPAAAACPFSPIVVLTKSPNTIADAIETPVVPAPPGGDWTNLFLPTP